MPPRGTSLLRELITPISPTMRIADDGRPILLGGVGVFGLPGQLILDERGRPLELLDSTGLRLWLDPHLDPADIPSGHTMSIIY